MLEFFQNIGTFFRVAGAVWYIVLPPFLYFLFKLLWMHHIWRKFSKSTEWVLLEIIPPREIEKSPHPMELIYAGFAGVIKTSSAIEEFVKGEIPVAFSLELVSTEGVVHFYIRTQKQFQPLVEAHFYAQYPDVEIVEAEDYTKKIPRTIPNKEWDLWGTEFKLLKHDAYPIRTYKFFEESVTGKMIDPLAGLIETMGKIGPGQHLWLQFLIAPERENWGPEKGQKVVEELTGKAKKESAGILARLWHDFSDIFRNLFPGVFGGELTWTSLEQTVEEEGPLEFRLTPGEKDVLKALQSNIGKPMYKTKMRHVYLGHRENFQKGIGISAFIGGIKQFNDLNLNSMIPDDLQKTYASYVFIEERLRYRQRRILRRYITRDSDPQGNRFMLSSEELATIFHLPDMTVTAPALTKVATRRGSAPANLPVE